MDDPRIGKTIGKYRIVEHLGRGGMAEVYKAYQSNLDRYVAIKMMHTFLSDEKEFLARFEREAKVVATLRHPNIVQVYDFDVEGGVYYMVMEYINGESLKSRMQDLETRGEWISLDDASRIILAVGSALKYAHERGMVHRDVKPANVMITTDGQVILTDFGIAKIVSTSNLTASGAMVGTPSYMAPEQGMGQPGDERSDIYSLGVMLYQLVLGRLPYDADTPLAVVLKHINDPLPSPKALKPDISDDLNHVIVKALAKDPGDRYQKVADLRADLRKAMGMSPDDSQAEAARSSSMKLAGATMVARVGNGVTPPPKPVTVAAPQEQLGTQVSAPQTVIAGAATVLASAPAVAAPVATKKRPGWVIPAVIVAVLAIVGISAVAIVGGAGGSPPAPTPTAAVAAVAPATTEVPAATPTTAPLTAPLTAQLQQLAKETELRDKAGSDPSSRIEGLLPAGSQFFVKARTGDSQWVRIETPDGVNGWIDGKATGLTAEQLGLLPAATTLTRLTDTPAPATPPTEAPTDTATPLSTNTTAPTRPPGPTKAPATPQATATPQQVTPTTSAATVPLGFGFSFDHCDYGGTNYTCNITVWGSGGSGSYFFAMHNPDTGNWDQRGPIDRTVFLMRSRRCRTQIQELRVWDSAGNYLTPNPNITMDPGAIASLFPGGSCTP